MSLLQMAFRRDSCLTREEVLSRKCAAFFGLAAIPLFQFQRTCALPSTSLARNLRALSNGLAPCKVLAFTSGRDQSWPVPSDSVFRALLCTWRSTEFLAS